MTRRLRVVVADDSAFMRRLLADVLERHGFDVAECVEDGDQALSACLRLRPDVLSLDLAMPGMDGIGVLRELRRTGSPVAVVVVSAFSPEHGAHAIEALAEGAVELVAKPASNDHVDSFAADLGAKVRLAGASRRRQAPSQTHVQRQTRTAPGSTSARVVAIACSTGGPQALTQLMPRLPSPLGGGTVIVQHMPAGFTRSLAARLDTACALNVREACDGDRLDPREVLVAPGGRHMRLGADRSMRLDDEAPIGGLRPRADLTISDLAGAFGRDVLLVVLTGMGKDGLEGAREVHRRGGRVLVEAETSCTVYGMPRAIVESGLADAIHELAAMPQAIVTELAA